MAEPRRVCPSQIDFLITLMIVVRFILLSPPGWPNLLIKHPRHSERVKSDRLI